jgi:hypothetical protein
MCCLRYEHEFYVQSRKRFPKEGKMLVTPRGEEKVVANDIFNERVTLRMSDGESRVVPLAALRAELEAAGSPLPFGMAAASPPSGTPPESNGDDASLSDEGGEQAVASLGSDDDARALAVLEEQPGVNEPDVVADAAGDPPEAQPGDAKSSADARGPRRRGRRGGRRGRGRGGAPGPGESRDGAQDDSGGDEPPPSGSPSSGVD